MLVLHQKSGSSQKTVQQLTADAPVGTGRRCESQIAPPPTLQEYRVQLGVWEQAWVTLSCLCGCGWLSQDFWHQAVSTRPTTSHLDWSGYSAGVFQATICGGQLCLILTLDIMMYNAWPLRCKHILQALFLWLCLLLWCVNEYVRMEVCVEKVGGWWCCWRFSQATTGNACVYTNGNFQQGSNYVTNEHR